MIQREKKREYLIAILKETTNDSTKFKKSK